MEADSTYDAIVVGGGPAGLSTALYLGRLERQTLVCDSGDYRNAPADHAHGFLTRDGVSPSTLRECGRDDLNQYPAVTYRQTTVTDAEQTADGFSVTLADEERVTTRTIVLATGITDELPPIDGIEALWGASVINCPYCHGYEVRDEPLAVYAPRSEYLPYVKLMCQLSDEITILTDGHEWVDDETRDRLHANGIQIRSTPVTALEGTDDEVTVLFTDETSLSRRALLVHTEAVTQRSPLAESLGCSLTEENIIETDDEKRTSVDGVYVAGDAARHARQLSFAVSDGAVAGITVTRDLAEEDFNRRCHSSR